MRTVRGPDGGLYVLCKESRGACLIRDPESGERRHVPTGSVDLVDGTSPLATIGRAVPDSTRRHLPLPEDDRVVGLLAEIDERGPLDVRTMLDDYGLCESDLHGLLGEFSAAGLVEESDRAQETSAGRMRAYQTTDRGQDLLSARRVDESDESDSTEREDDPADGSVD